MKKVIIYTGNLCIHCDWAIELLNRKNIKFTEYNIAKDTVKREEMFKKSAIDFIPFLSGSTHSSFS